ncbi:MAG: hypothetical protein ACXWW8_05330 [Solirubrobacterales bacterium]
MEHATAEKTRFGLKRSPKSGVAARVEELRATSKREPEAAQEQTWDWFKDLGKSRAHAELDELFALGKAPKGLEGRTEGILVVPFIQGVLDRGMTGLTRLMPLPWLGKRFDAVNSRGDNLLRGSARIPVKALWPRYKTKKVEGGRAAFGFVTRTERGKHDPGTDVLVIDYAPVESNPDHLIRSIRDELVEIAPGANLGKILYSTGEDEYRNLGFFALRPAD